jgi:hypothetical protein
MFCVKFVVYYYPFFYGAFIQEHVEGCGGSDTGCIDLLEENLAIFFITHIVTVLVGIAIPIGTFYYAVYQEKKKAKDKEYTYLQAQAKCAEYAGDIDDFMELVLSLGFVMMFVVVLPVMAPLACLCNLIELRLQAFKMMYVTRRTNPVGQEGIGAWAEIIKIMATMSVIINVALAVFSMHPIKDKPMHFKLLAFLGAEHVLFMITSIIQRCTPPMELTQEAIIEHEEDVEDDIQGDQEKKVHAEPNTNPPALPMYPVP